MQLMARSPWDTEPTTAEDVMVQVSIRMPYWYRQKLQATAPNQTVGMIMLDLAGRLVPPVKDKRPKIASGT